MSEVDRARESPDDQCPPATPSDQNSPSTYINRLTPPPGTDFWRLQTFNVMTNQDIGGGVIVDAPTQILTWNIDAFVYTVNAPPGVNFSERGGLVYIILVHHGSAATGSVTNRSIEYQYNVTLTSPPTDARALRQLPPSHSGVENGDNTNYTIAFSQDMQMFRNLGNELTTFAAQYEDVIHLRNGKQMGFVNGHLGTQWSVQFDPAPAASSNFPFASLSVYRLPDHAEVTFECRASVIRSSFVAKSTRSITVDCRF